MHRAKLECGHYPEWRTRGHLPRVGDEMYCFRCQRYVLCIGIPAEWRVKCQDCRLSRRFGAAQITAEIAAGKHARRFAGHRVTVWQEGAEDKGRTVSAARTPLPKESLAIPF